MVTKVGMQSDFGAALKDLIELDFDVMEAYDAAINRIDQPDYRSKLSEFKEDYQKHVQELSEVLRQHDAEPPQGPSGKQWITKGKVVLGNLIGDHAILSAMLSNEQDTNTAYERMVAHEDRWEDAAGIVERGLENERQHKAWLEETLNHH